MLCEFALPSNQDIVVRLREATVQDAIDFSAIDPDCEEEATSLFLERVQERETYSDPRTWTGEDRRYALFVYHVNTSTYKSVPLTYTCSICGKQHTQDVPNIDIMNSYTPMQGKPFREFPHEGHNVIVRPLTGADLEMVEKYRVDLERTEERLEAGNLTNEEQRRIEAEIRAKRVRMLMYRVICCVDMPYLDEQGTPQSRRGQVEGVVRGMDASIFKEFFAKVEEALAEMRHGLRSTYLNGQIVLEIPDVKCDERPDVPGVTIRYPFRFGAVIPTL